MLGDRLFPLRRRYSHGEEAVMSLHQKKIDVLSVLFENLQQDQPQLVPSQVIAEKLNLSLSELQQLLKIMDGNGTIESDLDLQFNLITTKGLRWLSRRHPAPQDGRNQLLDGYR